MKTLANCRVSFVAWLCVGGFVLADDPPRPASAEPAPQATDAKRERTGVIDMAYVFKNYARFVDERDELKKEIQESDVSAKLMAKEIEELKGALGQAKKGTPEHAELQVELARKTGDFETFRSQAQANFLKREAQIYKGVYLEVKQAVSDHGDRHGYTFVIRFSRENVQEKSKPEEILQAINAQFVYFRPERDITDDVLKQLNDAYKRDATAKKQADKQ